MASEKITALIEEVKGLTVLELSELVKALEEEFGVSAAAPVAVAAAPADGGAARADPRYLCHHRRLVPAEAQLRAGAHHPLLAGLLLPDWPAARGVRGADRAAVLHQRFDAAGKLRQGLLCLDLPAGRRRLGDSQHG